MIEISVKQSRPNFTLDVDVKLGHGITALFGASGRGKIQPPQSYRRA